MKVEQLREIGLKVIDVLPDSKDAITVLAIVYVNVTRAFGLPDDGAMATVAAALKEPHIDLEK